MASERVNEIIRQIRFEAETLESGDLILDLLTVYRAAGEEIGKIIYQISEHRSLTNLKAESSKLKDERGPDGDDVLVY